MSDLGFMVGVPLNGIVKIAVSGSAKNVNGEDTSFPGFDRVFIFTQGFGEEPRAPTRRTPIWPTP